MLHVSVLMLPPVLKNERLVSRMESALDADKRVISKRTALFAPTRKSAVSPRLRLVRSRLVLPRLARPRLEHPRTMTRLTRLHAAVAQLERPHTPQSQKTDRPEVKSLLGTRGGRV
jgi:hypothetical protein